METELPPVSELVPHRGDLLLLDRVLAHDGETTTARVVIGAGGWLHGSDGSAPSWLALEYMAQCAAAHEGLLALAEGRDLPNGLLISAVGLHLHQECFGEGEVLRVSARRARGRPGLGALSHTCSILADRAGRRLLAEGRLTVSVQAPTSA